MGKLHELLAVEGDHKGKSEKIRKEALHTFTKKQSHFHGQVRTYEPLAEDGQKFPREFSPRNDTVPDKLAFALKHYGRFVDIQYQKEAANTKAFADVVVDGETVLESVPVGALLNLEHHLADLRELLASMPTLDPSEEWVAAPDEGKHVYQAAPRQTHKTEKVSEPVILYEATEQHPAQVKLEAKNVVVGTWTIKKTSGEITPAEKAEYLDRCDKLSDAVKKARVKANMTDVTANKVADTLFNFVLTGNLSG